MLLRALDKGEIDISVWGLDPSLNSAVQFSLAESLVERCSSGIVLTELGKDYVKELIEQDVMTEDIGFLKDVGKEITETMVSKISDSWG